MVEEHILSHPLEPHATEQILEEDHIPFNIMGDCRNVANNHNNDNPPPCTFTYPISIDADDDTTMKNISPTFLPTFRGLSTKAPDQFVFEFKVLC